MHRKRLDEILIEEGLITESEIKDALLRQSAHSGRFGSQLLYYRYIDEETLVRALEKQLGCQGVVISQKEIAPDVVKMVPKKIALSRKVMPFEYDAELRTVKIACEDPNDQSLMKELAFLASGNEISLYVAAELALNTVIAKHYLGRDINLDDKLLLEIPDDATMGDSGPELCEKDEGSASDTPAVVFITDEEFAPPLVQSILEREGYCVVVAPDDGDLADIAGEHRLHAVFARDGVVPDQDNLPDRVRRISPAARFRLYKDIGELVLGGDADETVDLMVANLDIFTSLLSSRDDQARNHSGLVGHYADKLCGRMNLPDRERILITDAAYLHDLARFYYGAEQAGDNSRVVQLTFRLLASLSYSPDVLKILGSMYTGFENRDTSRLPLEVLGGSVVTIADLFCDALPVDERLSLDKFDGIKKKLRDQAGKLFLPEVVEAFIDMIQEEVLNLHADGAAAQVMIYAEDLTLQQPMELRLKNEGFRTVSHCSLDSLLDLYARSRPDLMIATVIGGPRRSEELIGDLKSGGVDLASTPLLLVVESGSPGGLTRLLQMGVEDVIVLEENLDLLVSKVRKLADRIALQPSAEGPDAMSGTHGQISDVNLVDLLQALGTGLKTVRITVSAHGDGERRIELYLNRGDIIFAKLGDLTGAEAVYEAITWIAGAWHVAPVAVDDLPAPNNDLSNQSILMEGCRRLDEKVKAGHLV